MSTFQQHSCAPAVLKIAVLQILVALCVSAAAAADKAAAESVTISATPAPVDAARHVMDPARDGWESEALSEAANGQLKRLAALLRQPERLRARTLSPLVSDQFSCPTLRPAELRTVWQDADLVVRRAVDFDPTIDNRRGPDRLAEALRQLLGPLASGKIARLKFKQFRIEVEEQTFATRAYLHAAGTVGDRILEQSATVTCRWIVEREGKPPLLLGMRASDFEEVATGRGPGTMFVDCTKSALGHNACFGEQLMFGQEHWLRRRQMSLGIDNTGLHGLAVGDVNGDGLEDVYVCQTGGLPNRLFVQNDDGTATDVSREAGVDFMERTHSALLIDMDNDGDQDLVLATEAAILVLANDGVGRFTVKAMGDFPDAMSLSAADYDADGDLDIYACHYAVLSHYRKNAGVGLRPIPYHDANNGSPNALLRNDGDWTLTDVTAEVGLDQNNNRWSYAAAWEDYDNDGDQDLYVANDFGRNNLYQNDEGTFRDVAAQTGVKDIASGMSVSWGDYNRDGHMDLYVGNMFSAAGGRIAYQRRFHEQSGGDVRGHLRRLARGNTLFLNKGDGRFADASEDAAVTMGRWAWSSNWVDLNNDGWLDLVVANGYITGARTDDL